MKDTSRDPLADRLEALDITVPVTLIPSVLSNASQKPASRWAPWWLAIPGVALVALVMVTAGSYFMPAFGQGLADAPFVGRAAGPFLRNAGLATVSGRITALDDAATSSGYKIRLLGGYADSARTVLLIHVDPPGRLALFPTTVLTDQFGRSYDFRYGHGVLGGDEAVGFGPIGWPASRVGARLTLHVSRLTAFPSDGNDTVVGSWNLHGTLAVDEGKSLPEPRPARLGNLAFKFDSVQATPGALQVKMTVTGTAGVDLGRVIPDSLKGHPAFNMQLIDPGGEAVPWPGMESRQAGDRNSTQVTALWLRTAPGRYRLTMSYEGLGEFERQIDVP